MYCKLALGNVRKSMRDYGVYFLTLVFGVCVFYAFNSMTAQSTVLSMSESQYQMITLLSDIIGGVSVFVAIILGFLIVYASRYLIRRRKAEFGTYLLLGMSPSKVSRIIIYETLFVGILSLLVGLLLGILLSQALLYITAALFTIKMDGLAFVFSIEAFAKTISYFAVIFVIALAFNVVSVSRFKLIDLINANRVNESMKLRNLPLSVILFIISVVLIILAYDQLLQNGMREFDSQFALSTVLVCIGTLLFFYSLSGFLLRAIQTSKRMYYRGLNMFKLRQLNAKINTAFVSITLVCMALFLAITSTCGGFSLGATFTQNLEKATLYDASLTAYYADPNEEDAPVWAAEAETAGYDMESALSHDIATWDSLVAKAAQLNYYTSELSLREVVNNSDGKVSNSLYQGDIDSMYLELVTLSDYNKLRALSGLTPLTLASGEYLLWCDFEELFDLYESLLEKGISVTAFGRHLQPASTTLETTLAQSGSLPMNTGTLVVSDDIVPEDALFYRSVMNVMYNGERDAVEADFKHALNSTYIDTWSDDESLRGWPLTYYLTALEMYEQNTGLSAVIAYLAIYIGLVLLLACAAILALQQLTEAADNTARYGILERIGADKGMINRALFTQIGIYFIFPLILAFCHALVALSVVIEVVTLYGHLDIVEPLAITLALFLFVYGGYFLITYFASKAMIHTKLPA